MTAPETRWTAETEGLLVARNHEAECGGPIEDCVFLQEHGIAAREALEVLADAGLLLPPGGVTREQWRFEDTFDDDDLVVSSKYFAEPPPEVKARWPEKSLRRRTVYTGPWIEVPS